MKRLLTYSAIFCFQLFAIFVLVSCVNAQDIRVSADGHYLDGTFLHSRNLTGTNFTAPSLGTGNDWLLILKNDKG